MDPSPEVAEIEARASAASVDMDAVLKRAGVAKTTWWRWSGGQFEPRLATLRKVREALEQEVADRSES